MAKLSFDDEWDTGIEVRKKMWIFYGRDNDTIECKVDQFWTFLKKNESFETNVPDGDCFLKFKEVTQYLSSKFQEILDQVDFFHEVSILACGGIDSNTRCAEKYYAKKFLKDYVELYCNLVTKYQPVDDCGDIVLTKACEHFCNEIYFAELMTFLIMSEDAKQLHLGLKLLEISLRISEKLRKLGIDRELLLILYNFQLISPDKCEDIPSKIFKLAKTCFKKFNTPYDNVEGEINPIDYIKKSSFETKQAFLYKTLMIAIYDKSNFIRIYEQYYFEKICMSAKDDEERRKYMKTILEVFDNYRRVQFRNHINNEFKCVVDQILFYLTKHFGEPSQKIEDKMRYIDKYHGIKIDPYGGPKILEDNVVLEPPVEEIDYLVEKHAVYDYFMRCLQILTILHTAFLCREKIYLTCKEVEGDHKKIFRSNDIESYVCSKLSDKSKCGNLPWYIEMILRKCPFVVFEFPEKDIIDGLIKILKNEDVDEDLEKKVCIALKLDVDDKRLTSMVAGRKQQWVNLSTVEATVELNADIAHGSDFESDEFHLFGYKGIPHWSDQDEATFCSSLLEDVVAFLGPQESKAGADCTDLKED